MPLRLNCMINVEYLYKREINNIYIVTLILVLIYNSTCYCYKLKLFTEEEKRKKAIMMLVVFCTISDPHN